MKERMDKVSEAWLPRSWTMLVVKILKVIDRILIRVSRNNRVKIKTRRQIRKLKLGIIK